MISNFVKDQSGSVSPQFAIIISTFFLAIGAGLYYEGETVYRLFDQFMDEIRYAVNF